ncbi:MULTISPECIES: DUF5908 family protein [unclassified Rhizobacter]|uniref:DUF5908 family protein n=1 Tax=unclassified Rhizobacter TaxID=2640088 RepID=UPI000AC50F0E|nr:MULTISPECIES: DUF5908 family protein [unclassified Rhizobacter]
MSIEVRQLLIRSQVQAAPVVPQRQGLASAELQRLREQLLAECKAWLVQQLRSQRER